MSLFKKLLLSLATALTLTGTAYPVAAAESAGPAWPTAVVKFEDLRAITHFKLQVPGLVAKGRVTGPAILQAHINTEGFVTRTALLASCGNPDLDEASLHAMRVMQFQPYTLDGAPSEVTLVVPVHVPARLGRSPR